MDRGRIMADINPADKIDIELLKKLSEIKGCAGHEKNIREFIKNIITPLCDEVKTDTIGNLYGIKYGKDRDRSHSILLAAHMDEIGFMVRYIEKEGFIRVANVGGQNIRLLPGTRVCVSGSKQEVFGVFGEKAIHLMDTKDREKVTPLDECFIDVGMPNKEEVEKYISVGDYIEFDQPFMRFLNSSLVNGKAFDDRLGCYVLIHALQEVSKISQEKTLEQTVIFCFSTQEELGTRGAMVAGFQTKPTSAVVLEVTHGIDYPSVSKSKIVEIDLGKGPSICVGPNLHPVIANALIETAKKNKIPFQIEPESAPTGTDARSIQVTGPGIPVGLVAVPLRYMHTMIETIDLKDLTYTSDLITKYIMEKLSDNYNL
jgi:putative aminopeptidase FrvX